MKYQLPPEFKLPVFSKIVRECLVYMYKPDADTSTLARTLGNDIGVTANILKLANSSYFLLGKGTSTSDLKAAIMRIGQDNLRQILLLNALENTIYFPDMEFFNFKSFCHHASFTSLICTEMAKKVNPSFVSDIQIAALMHDVGLSIIASIFPEDMKNLIKYCIENQTDFATAEKALSLESHAELGARVLKTWEIPENVINIILYHHIRHPENRPNLDAPTQVMADILVLGDILAHSYGYGYKDYKRDTKIEFALLKRLGLQTEEVKEILRFCVEIASVLNT